MVLTSFKTHTQQSYIKMNINNWYVKLIIYFIYGNFKREIKFLYQSCKNNIISYSE